MLFVKIKGDKSLMIKKNNIVTPKSKETNR